jgi:hypothetical protein
VEYFEYREDKPLLFYAGSFISNYSLVMIEF